MNHKFPYRWTLKDARFTKDKGKVFSCFACGGGATMGYKLAGYDVIGCNEIDPRMMYAYCQNHDPRFPFLEPIQEFKNRADLPNFKLATVADFLGIDTTAGKLHDASFDIYVTKAVFDFIMSKFIIRGA